MTPSLRPRLALLALLVHQVRRVHKVLRVPRARRVPMVQRALKEHKVLLGVRAHEGSVVSMASKVYLVPQVRMASMVLLGNKVNLVHKGLQAPTENEANTVRPVRQAFRDPQELEVNMVSPVHQAFRDPQEHEVSMGSLAHRAQQEPQVHKVRQVHKVLPDQWGLQERRDQQASMDLLAQLDRTELMVSMLLLSTLNCRTVWVFSRTCFPTDTPWMAAPQITPIHMIMRVIKVGKKFHWRQGT